MIEKRLINEMVSQLKSIEQWFVEQRHFLFFATSLLLAYDADPLTRFNRGRSEELNVRVRMIDFAHVYPSVDGSPDSNYLEGIGKLIQIIESFL